MISRFRRWQFETPAPALGYSIAALIAAVAQVARMPLYPPTLMPHISYVPFIVMSAALTGFGPGLLTTGICLFESMYFATDPVGSFRVGDPALWGGLAALAFTGLVTSMLFESLKRARRAYAAVAAAQAQSALELDTRQRMLESVVQHSPAAIALMHGPEFTLVMVNPAYQALVPGEPLVGRTVAYVWPAAAPEIIPLLNVVRDMRTAYHTTGYALPVSRSEPATAEERYFDFSFVPLAGSGGEGDVEVLLVAIETTEHKRAEAALHAAYSQLTAIYANAPVILLVIDEHLHVRQANDLAVRLAGKEASVMSGLLPGGALGCLNAVTEPEGCGYGPSCGQCPLRLTIFDTLTSGTSHEGIEAVLPLCVDGQWQPRCLLVSTTAMKFDLSTHVLVCAQDITERKQAEVELALS